MADPVVYDIRTYPPSDRALGKVRWARSRIDGLMQDGHTWIVRDDTDDADGVYYVVHPTDKDNQDKQNWRRIVHMEDMDEDTTHRERLLQVLAKEFHNIPPSLGYLRWFSLLNRKYVGIPRSLVKSFLERQEDHQIFRRIFRPSFSVSTPLASTPGERWHCDVAKMTHKSNHYEFILVFIDYISKYVFTYPMARENAATISAKVTQWLTDLKALAPHIKPKTLVSDNGPGFVPLKDTIPTGDDGKPLVTHIRIAPNRPQANGIVERVIQTLKGYLTSTTQRCATARFDTAAERDACIADGGTMTQRSCLSAGCWGTYLPEVTNIINTTWHRMLKGYTPREVLLSGPAVYTPIVKQLEEYMSRRTRSSMHNVLQLEEGDKVRLSLRITGSAYDKTKFKQHTRKGYLQNWEPGLPYTVRRRIGNFYELREIPGKRFDRNDLLLIPNDGYEDREIEDGKEPTEEDPRGGDDDDDPEDAVSKANRVYRELLDVIPEDDTWGRLRDRVDLDESKEEEDEEKDEEEEEKRGDPEQVHSQPRGRSRQASRPKRTTPPLSRTENPYRNETAKRHSHDPDRFKKV